MPFDLPPVIQGGPSPIWENNGFRIGDQFTTVAEYSSHARGWSDNLTIFHEETAGGSHFIDHASRQYALQQLASYFHNGPPVILEVGCSSGLMLQSLRERFQQAVILGSDIIPSALKRLASRMPGIPLLQFDIVHCPLPDNSVDAVVLLNVLEHIDEESDALRQVHRILKPGGVAVIEVPAGPHLYDMYDKMLLHRRRYTLSGLETLVKQSGLKVGSKSHLGFFIYYGFRMVKKRNQHLSALENGAIKLRVEQNIRDTGNSRFLSLLMKAELFLGKWFYYPVGIRCLMTGIKP